MSELEQRKIAAAVRRLEKMRLADCFDPNDLDSRPNPVQLEFYKDIQTYKYRIIRAGNQSGKSQSIAREISWLLNGTHPYFIRPENWGDEPLLILVAGQDRKNIEIELWGKKISAYLDKSEWREVRQGGSLQYVENRETKDKIVFLTHSDSTDKNRRHMQGYVAHYVWVDEMPGSDIILEELQRRVDARQGYFTASFTPKFRNDKIRRVIDSLGPPLGKVYSMSKLDNPIYADRKEEEIKKLEGYSEAYKNSILYGDWFIGESQVYHFDHDMMVQALPDNYSYGWRHVVSVDPAIKSKCGLTLWAENPSNNVWFLVKDDYIENMHDPEDLLFKIEEQIKGYNIVRRITDTMAWFTSVAIKHKINYVQPYDKNSRKQELIKNLQHSLSSGKIKITPHCSVFIDEIQGCQWSETSDRIVAASTYHTLDAAQYFVDCAPKPDPSQISLPFYKAAKEHSKKLRKQEHQQKAKISHGGRVGKNMRAWGSRNKHLLRKSIG